MKELLKQAFQAGRDFGHAMGTGRPIYGLTFNEWYNESENQALSLGAVVGQSEQLKAFAVWLQKRMWEGGDKDFDELVDEFLSL